MGIWTYNNVSRDTELNHAAIQCPFCKVELNKLKDEGESNYRDIDWEVNNKQYFACESCGWWKITEEVWFADNNDAHSNYIYSAATASLKEFSLINNNESIDEIRSYLLRKYSKRHEVNPKVFEDVVSSVYSDLGYQTITTSYSSDGGIDIFAKKGNKEFGIQVKRYKNKIKVEQIRSLAGALVLKGLTRGIFVTTSDFQSGAKNTVNEYLKAGYRIELIDSEKLFKDLSIGERKPYKNVFELESSIPSSIKMQVIHGGYHP